MFITSGFRCLFAKVLGVGLLLPSEASAFLGYTVVPCSLCDTMVLAIAPMPLLFRYRLFCSRWVKARVVRMMMKVMMMMMIPPRPTKNSRSERQQHNSNSQSNSNGQPGTVTVLFLVVVPDMATPIKQDAACRRHHHHHQHLNYSHIGNTHHRRHHQS